MEHSRLLKFIKGVNDTTKMAESQKANSKVEAEVPGEQKIREDQSEFASENSTLRDSNKGDKPMIISSYTEVYTETVEDGKVVRKHQVYSHGKPGDEDIEKADEKPKTKIPISRLRQTVEKVREERRKQKKERKNSETNTQRRSSIPVPINKADKQTDKATPDDEFDKLYQEVINTAEPDQIQLRNATEDIEIKFEEIIHHYEEINEVKDDVSKARGDTSNQAKDDKVKKSKIPALKRKSLQEIELSNETDRKSKIIAARDKVRVRKSVSKDEELKIDDQVLEQVKSKMIAKSDSNDVTKSKKSTKKVSTDGKSSDLTVTNSEVTKVTNDLAVSTNAGEVTKVTKTKVSKMSTKTVNNDGKSSDLTITGHASEVTKVTNDLATSDAGEVTKVSKKKTKNVTNDGKSSDLTVTSNASEVAKVTNTVTKEITSEVTEVATATEAETKKRKSKKKKSKKKSSVTNQNKTDEISKDATINDTVIVSEVTVTSNETKVVENVSSETNIEPKNEKQEVNKTIINDKETDAKLEFISIEKQIVEAKNVQAVINNVSSTNIESKTKENKIIIDANESKNVVSYNENKVDSSDVEKATKNIIKSVLESKTEEINNTITNIDKDESKIEFTAKKTKIEQNIVQATNINTKNLQTEEKVNINESKLATNEDNKETVIETKIIKHLTSVEHENDNSVTMTTETKSNEVINDRIAKSDNFLLQGNLLRGLIDSKPVFKTEINSYKEENNVVKSVEVKRTLSYSTQSIDFVKRDDQFEIGQDNITEFEIKRQDYENKAANDNKFENVENTSKKYEIKNLENEKKVTHDNNFETVQNETEKFEIKSLNFQDKVTALDDKFETVENKTTDFENKCEDIVINDNKFENVPNKTEDFEIMNVDYKNKAAAHELKRAASRNEILERSLTENNITAQTQKNDAIKKENFATKTIIDKKDIVTTKTVFNDKFERKETANTLGYTKERDNITIVTKANNISTKIPQHENKLKETKNTATPTKEKDAYITKKAEIDVSTKPVLEIKKKEIDIDSKPESERDDNINELADFKGKVGRLINKLGAKETNDNESNQNDAINEMPKKKSILSKIALFENQETESYPIKFKKPLSIKMPKPVTKPGTATEERVHVHTPLIVDEIFKPFEGNKLVIENKNNINEEIVLKENLVTEEIKSNPYVVENKVQIEVQTVESFKSETTANDKINIATVSKENELKVTENKVQSPQIIDAPVIIPKIRPVREILGDFEPKRIQNKDQNKVAPNKFIEIPKLRPFSEIVSNHEIKPKIIKRELSMSYDIDTIEQPKTNEFEENTIKIEHKINVNKVHIPEIYKKEIQIEKPSKFELNSKELKVINDSYEIFNKSEAVKSEFSLNYDLDSIEQPKTDKIEENTTKIEHKINVNKVHIPEIYKKAAQIEMPRKFEPKTRENKISNSSDEVFIKPEVMKSEFSMNYHVDTIEQPKTDKIEENTTIIEHKINVNKVHIPEIYKKETQIENPRKFELITRENKVLNGNDDVFNDNFDEGIKIIDKNDEIIIENTNLKPKEGIRAKSLAELDVNDAVKGKVTKIIHRIKSYDILEQDRKEVTINVKEMPKKLSVLEKIALFERKSSTTPIKTLNTTFSTKSVGISEKIHTKNTADDIQEKIQELINAKKYGTTTVPEMELANGIKMPVIAVGTALLDPRLIKHIIGAAIDLGYRAIDTAYIYGNEKEVGEAIRAKIEDGTVKREDLFITSKLWSTFHRTDLVMEACEASLKALGLDYFDLYLIHNPMSFKEGKNPLPKIANVMQYSSYDYIDAWFGMEQVYKSGLARGIGVSNFNSLQLQKVLDKGSVNPLVNQVECHPYLTQQKLSHFCSDRSIVLSCYGVLGSKGTPSDNRGTAPACIDDPLALVMASGLGVSAAQLLIQYQLDSGHTAVVKASSAARLWDNLQSLKLQLTSVERDALNALNKNRRNFTFTGMGDTHKNYPFNIPF